VIESGGGAGVPPPERAKAAGSALIVGSGLIGASIGLALRAAGWTVQLADVDPSASATAAALGAGRAVRWPPMGGSTGSRYSPDPGPEPADIAVIAVPPAAVAPAAVEVAGTHLASTMMHVASVQARPQVDLESSGADVRRIVGTHPMAGRERGGAAGATPGLFRDRPWVVCAGGSGERAVRAARGVIGICGAREVVLTAEEHDAAVALVSHLPQLVSSAVAAMLTSGGSAAVGIAGSGLRDVTRLAEAEPELWQQIISYNAPAVRAPLRELLGRLTTLLEALEAGEAATSAAVAQLLAAGRMGRQRLGGKHGGRPRHWASVQVVVPDRPGALVDVLSACRDRGVNVEDLRLEHSPGRPDGLLELLVEPARAADLADALRAAWDVLGVEQPHE
jgi:prephenate dehydrogenase